MDIYSAATGGTILASISANPNAPTTLSGFTPASTTTTYYVECKQPSSGCTSTRVMAGTFTVAAVIPVPVATAAMPVLCAGTPFSIASDFFWVL